MNKTKPVASVQFGEYDIWLGGYNPYNAYSRMLAAYCAHEAAALLSQKKLEEAEAWCAQNYPEAAGIMAAERAGALAPMIAPGSLPVDPALAALQQPIVEEIMRREHLHEPG